jgi:hypothetical protein
MNAQANAPAKTTIELKDEPKKDPKKKQLDDVHTLLKTIAERGTMAGERSLAACVMVLVEIMRGEEPKTELPKQHHA